MTGNEKKREISAATVLMPLMLILVMCMALGCDLLGDESVDTKSLEAAITEAKSLLNNTTVSEDGSGVSAGAYWATNAEKNTLNTAITTAEGVLNTAKTQDDIDSATNVLRTAIDLFKTQRTLKSTHGNKIGEITGTITLTNIPATGRPKVSIRAGIDAAGISYDSDICEISLSGVPSSQTQAELNWAIPVYENEELPPRARFGLIVTPQGTTSSMYIDIYHSSQGSEINIPANRVVGNLGTYSIGTIVLSGTINVKVAGSAVPQVEMSACSAIERIPLGGYTSLSSPGTNSPWAMVLPSIEVGTGVGVVLEITGLDNSWNTLFNTLFRSDLLTNVTSNVSGININLGDIKTITVTNIPDAYYDDYYIYVSLFSSKDDIDVENNTIFGSKDVYDSSLTLSFLDNEYKAWTGSGSYYVVVSFAMYGSASTYYVSKAPVNFATSPTVNFDTDFDNGEREFEGKNITITNIPNKYQDGTYEINVYLFESNTNIIINGFNTSAYGYNYIDGSSMTVELYEPVFYDLWTGTGSYYVVVSFADYYSPLENFISNNKVSFTENPTINFNTELQKYDDFAPPVNTVILDKNIWESGYLSYNEPVVWYRFEVEKNKDYEIFINDSDWDNDYYKADVLMDIYLNGVKIKSRLDIGFDYNTGDFTADESGTVHVRVYLVDFDSSGSFDIGYNTSGDRSKLEWPLTGFLWMSGNFEHSDVVFFSFQAEAGKTYNIWWEDFDTDEDKIDVKVSVYLITSTGETTICEDEGVSTNDISFKGPGYVLIAVTALDPGDAISENFEIAYSTDGKKPIRGM